MPQIAPRGLVSVTFDLILLSATMGHLFYSASVFDKDLKNTVAQSAASSPADFYDNLSETAECLKNRPDILKELFVTATFMTLGPLLSKVSKLGEEALVTYGYYDDLKTIAEIQD